MSEPIDLDGVVETFEDSPWAFRDRVLPAMIAEIRKLRNANRSLGDVVQDQVDHIIDLEECRRVLSDDVVRLEADVTRLTRVNRILSTYAFSPVPVTIPLVTL